MKIKTILYLLILLLVSIPTTSLGQQNESKKELRQNAYGGMNIKIQKGDYEFIIDEDPKLHKIEGWINKNFTTYEHGTVIQTSNQQQFLIGTKKLEITWTGIQENYFPFFASEIKELPQEIKIYFSKKNLEKIDKISQKD